MQACKQVSSSTSCHSMRQHTSRGRCLGFEQCKNLRDLTLKILQGQNSIYCTEMKLGRSKQTIHRALNNPALRLPLAHAQYPAFSCSHESHPQTHTFSCLSVFLADSKWGDSPAGKTVPPLQQNNPPPPEGPGDLQTSGFFGFLR